MASVNTAHYIGLRTSCSFTKKPSKKQNQTNKKTSPNLYRDMKVFKVFSLINHLFKSQICYEYSLSSGIVTELCYAQSQPPARCVTPPPPSCVFASLLSSSPLLCDPLPIVSPTPHPPVCDRLPIVCESPPPPPPPRYLIVSLLYVTHSPATWSSPCCVSPIALLRDRLPAVCHP